MANSHQRVLLGHIEILKGKSSPMKRYHFSGGDVPLVDVLDFHPMPIDSWIWTG